MSRLLLVDDDNTSVTMMAKPLQAIGHQVEIVGDGRQALHRLLASGQHYDLLITDLTMPVLDGRSLVLELRSRPATAYLPIIIVSNTTDGGDLRKLLDRHTAFMGKPVDSMQLSGAVGRMTNRRTTEFISLTADEEAQLARASRA